PMLERRRGGIILMSSLSSGQGTPLAANYAATKAYNQVLAEGLWDELRSKGVDVLVCSPSVVTKPGQPQAESRGFSAPAVSTQEVVSETIAALGHRPGVIPGRSSRMAAFFMRRLMPRRWAIQMMGQAMRSLYS
ncbi:MAG: SDR family NAD(P)-dependent oxidoreductase, partial [Anaerolineales bacterium]